MEIGFARCFLASVGHNFAAGKAIVILYLAGMIKQDTVLPWRVSGLIAETLDKMALRGKTEIACDLRVGHIRCSDKLCRRLYLLGHNVGMQLYSGFPIEKGGEISPVDGDRLCDFCNLQFVMEMGRDVLNGSHNVNGVGVFLFLFRPSEDKVNRLPDG